MQWKMLVHFMTIGAILRLLGIFCGHLVYFMVIWYIFPIFVCYTKKNLAPLPSFVDILYINLLIDVEKSAGEFWPY
jgi:hypothetical protein